MNLHYRRLTLEDKCSIDEINHAQNQLISTYSFPVLFCWQEPLDMMTAVETDFFVVRHRTLPEYFFPCGPVEKTRLFVEALLAAKDPFTLFHLTTDQAAWAKAHYSELYIWEDRDNDNYLYRTEQLSGLFGKSYRTLRREFHQIEQQSTVQTEPITAGNLAQAKELLRRTMQLKQLTLQDKDFAANQRALEQYEALGLEGILLRDETGVFSMILGSALSDTVFDCHFIKSIGALPGHGTYGVYALAQRVKEKYPILNLEEDLGIPGLRYKKTLLKPTEILPVYCCSNFPQSVKGA